MRTGWIAVGVGVVAALACGGTPGTSETGPVVGGNPPPVDGSGGTPPDARQPPTPAATGTPLQALVATSGGDPAALLDGDASTTWTPGGDPQLEGVLVRFEAPTAIDTLEVVGCSSLTEGALTTFIDGVEFGAEKVTSQAPASYALGGKKLRSAYVSFSGYLDHSAVKGTACLADLRFLSGGMPLAIAPPRTVKGTLTASSVLEPAAAYHPGYLFDGRTDFGWVEGAKGPGKGEALTVDFAAPTEVAALEIWNGYQRSEDHFKKNARVASLTVEADGAVVGTLSVSDKAGAQKLALGNPVTAKRIVLRVDEVYKGSKYEDLVVSELRFHDGKGPFGVTTDDTAKQAGALATAMKGKPLASVTDHMGASACASDEVNGVLKLRANHTFVWYGNSFEWMENGESSAREVFDGAWVPKSIGSPWTEIELFGRRHRIEETFVPYGESTASDTTRIGGGKLKIARAVDLDADQWTQVVEEFGAGPAAERIDCIGADHEQAKKDGVWVVQGTAITDVFR